MYISPWFQASMLPDRWNVAGVSCPSLSVWHVFALTSLGNPYFCDSSRLDRNAAASLLLYATRTHAEGKMLNLRPNYRIKALRAMHKALERREWLDVHAAVSDYVANCTRAPGHKKPVSDGKGKGESRSAAAPFGWVLVDFLASGNPDRIEAAWNTPYAVACCLFDAHRDILGQDSTLETVEESERFDAYLARQKEAS
ncbi:MAG TPA: hypothetical protein DCY07_05100 [Rhodospirillaceae bacterium]|nr:hypothetical protein [Rhodospirillaceae bacterium]